MNGALAALYEAHVGHELSNWRGETLARTLSDRVHALWRWLSEITLDDVVTRDQIAGVIDRYVIDLRVSGGITELSGEMTHVVFTSPASRAARVDDILTPEMYAEFADKVLALEGVRRELLALIAHSETVSAISARLIARGLLDLARLAVPIPSATVRTALARIGARVLPDLERRAVEAVWKYRQRLRRDPEHDLIEVLDSEGLRSVVDELWDRIATRRLSDVFGFISEQDVEDFVVLIYEFWLRYRKSEFFRRISTELIDYFFRKYGEASVSAVIEDMGVTEAMVEEEVLALIKPVVEHAAVSGALERHIRERLRAFYESNVAAEALGR